MTVDGDDGDGRATDGRRMRRTAWWCGSAGVAEGGSAGSMWRFEKSFLETLEHRHMVHHDVRRGRTGDGRRTGAATTAVRWRQTDGGGRAAAGGGGMPARTLQSCDVDNRVCETSAEPATWWGTFLKEANVEEANVKKDW